jgi:hypothetical protein
MKGLASADDNTKIAEDAFAYFLKKRHEIELFPGVKMLSKLYQKIICLEFLLTAMQIFINYQLENILNFQLALLKHKIANPINHILN